MKTILKAAILLLFAAGAMASPVAQWKPGSGIQMRLAEGEWPAVLEDLLGARLNKKPYRLSKRTTAYDFDVHVITPFARAAEFVQAVKERETIPTYEEVSRQFDPGRLALRLKTAHRVREASEGVLAVLKTDARTVQPYQDKILSSMPVKIGQYYEQYHVVVRDFYFDASQVAGARSLSVVLMENDGATIEIPVDLGRLR